jgi:hypothetical protein
VSELIKTSDISEWPVWILVSVPYIFPRTNKNAATILLEFWDAFPNQAPPAILYFFPFFISDGIFIVIT